MGCKSDDLHSVCSVVGSILGILYVGVYVW